MDLSEVRGVLFDDLEQLLVGELGLFEAFPVLASLGMHHTHHSAPAELVLVVPIVRIARTVFEHAAVGEVRNLLQIERRNALDNHLEQLDDFAVCDHHNRAIWRARADLLPGVFDARGGHHERFTAGRHPEGAFAIRFLLPRRVHASFFEVPTERGGELAPVTFTQQAMTGPLCVLDVEQSGRFHHPYVRADEELLRSSRVARGSQPWT